MQGFPDLAAHANLGIYVQSVSFCIKGTEYGNRDDCQEEDVTAETEELDVKKVVLTTQGNSSCATDIVLTILRLVDIGQSTSDDLVHISWVTSKPVLRECSEEFEQPHSRIVVSCTVKFQEPQMGQHHHLDLAAKDTTLLTVRIISRYTTFFTISRKCLSLFGCSVTVAATTVNTSRLALHCLYSMRPVVYIRSILLSAPQIVSHALTFDFRPSGFELEDCHHRNKTSVKRYTSRPFTLHIMALALDDAGVEQNGPDAHFDNWWRLELTTLIRPTLRSKHNRSSFLGYSTSTAKVSQPRKDALLNRLAQNDSITAFTLRLVQSEPHIPISNYRLTEEKLVAAGDVWATTPARKR
ncbi:hypothetical protein D6D26_02796 [Aureobasidium pullulans]|nr:hypothetical protein D6D26_02796 [Aureobasidium pullulans]